MRVAKRSALLTGLLLVTLVAGPANAVPKPTKTARPTRTPRDFTPPTSTETPTPEVTPTETSSTPQPATATPTPIVPTSTPNTIGSPVAFRVAGAFAAGAAPSSIGVGNFNPSNGDANLDLVVTNRDDATVQWLQGKGTGAFLPRAAVSVGAQPMGLAVSDLDGDGMLDVATANSGDGTLSILFGNGDGTFDDAITTDVAVEPARDCGAR